MILNKTPCVWTKFVVYIKTILYKLEIIKIHEKNF